MSNDVLWDTTRSGLVAIGTLVSATGWFSVAQVEPVVDNVMAIGGLVVVITSFVWTIKVKFGTKAVPVVVAARSDIPTISPITGAVEPPNRFTQL